MAELMGDDWARLTMERLALSYERLAAHAPSERLKKLQHSKEIGPLGAEG